jgi:hypothetical protein
VRCIQDILQAGRAYGIHVISLQGTILLYSVFEQVLGVIVNYQTSLTPGERNIENYFKLVCRNSDTAHLLIEFVRCVCVCVCCLRILSITEHSNQGV